MRTGSNSAAIGCAFLYAVKSCSTSSPPPRDESAVPPPRFSDVPAELNASAASASDCEAGNAKSPVPRDFGKLAPTGGFMLVAAPLSLAFAEANNVSTLPLVGALAVRISEDVFE